MEGTSGAPGVEGTSDAVAEATEQIPSSFEGGAETASLTGVTAAADDTSADGVSDDEADLAQYPEAVRPELKAISPAGRKALYEQVEKYIEPRAEARVEARLKAERERADTLAATAAAEQAERDRILATQGKYVGAEATEINDEYGIRPGPTFDELNELMGTRAGRDELWEKFQLDEAGSERHKASLVGARAMLASSARLMDDNAWGKLAGHVKAALEKIPGVDPEAIVAGANGPQEWLPRLVGHLEERHQREKTVMQRGYEERLGAHTENAEGLRGRVIAAESRRLPTGGRTGGGSALSVLQRLKDEAGSPEEFARRAERGDYAGIDLTR